MRLCFSLPARNCSQYTPHYFLLSLFSSFEVPKLSSKVVNHAGQLHRRELAVSSPIYLASATQLEGAPTRHEASMFLPTDNLNVQMTFVPGELISSLASIHESTKDKVVRQGDSAGSESV
jgi:hypothetical protein